MEREPNGTNNTIWHYPADNPNSRRWEIISKCEILGFGLDK